MMKNIARVVSYLFHPILIPTTGFLILLNAGFYFSLLSWDAKRLILLVVFFSTAILPLILLAFLAFSHKFDFSFEKSTDRVVIQLITAVFYYLGYLLLGKIQISYFFKIFLISGALLIILSSIISLKWKISIHLAGLGGILGAIMALSFRFGLNPVLWIIGIILISGLVGTSRMLLGKHNLSQIIAGFFLGLAVFYPIVYFI